MLLSYPPQYKAQRYVCQRHFKNNYGLLTTFCGSSHQSFHSLPFVFSELLGQIHWQAMLHTHLKELIFVVQDFVFLSNLKISSAAFSIRNRGLVNFGGLSESMLSPEWSRSLRELGFFLPSGITKYRCTWGQN